MDKDEPLERITRNPRNSESLWSDVLLKLLDLGRQVFDGDILICGFTARQNSHYYDRLKTVMNTIDHAVSANADSEKISLADNCCASCWSRIFGKG